MTRPGGDPRLLAALLAGAGLAHLVRPQAFAGLIPHRLGRPGPWVLGSGLAELACAATVAVPRTRRAGGSATAVLFAVVLPGNVTVALRGRGRPPLVRALLWARVPLQVPLIRWALRATRG